MGEQSRRKESVVECTAQRMVCRPSPAAWSAGKNKRMYTHRVEVYMQDKQYHLNRLVSRYTTLSNTPIGKIHITDINYKQLPL